jgi:putrescine transport system ATP-binding protein
MVSTSEQSTQDVAEGFLQIRGLGKAFEGSWAVNDVDLNIHQGEIFALLGGSGCGKSTLLRMLAGFESPTVGSVSLDGVDLSALPPHHRPVNMMFQSYALFPHMTVEKNIAFGLKQDKLSRKQIEAKVTWVLELVQMSRFASRKPDQLSGGQQQRVALACCLAKSPKLLLLDEPLAALDKNLRSLMQLEIVNILEDIKMTCVMVTHDQEEAMTMADRVGIMHQGKLGQVGTPQDIYEQPNSRMTAQFVGSVNLFEGVVVRSTSDHAEIQSAALPRYLQVDCGIARIPGMELAVAVRPEKVRVSKKPPRQQVNVAQGRVEDIAYLGSHSVYHVRLPTGFKLMASEANVSRQHYIKAEGEHITWHDEVYLSWSSNCGVVLSA